MELKLDKKIEMFDSYITSDNLILFLGVYSYTVLIPKSHPFNLWPTSLVTLIENPNTGVFSLDGFSYFGTSSVRL